MDFTCKMSTLIPSNWNNPTDIEEHHNYAIQQVINPEKFDIYFNEAGFDLHTQESHGQAISVISFF